MTSVVRQWKEGTEAVRVPQEGSEGSTWKMSWETSHVPFDGTSRDKDDEFPVLEPVGVQSEDFDERDHKFMEVLVKRTLSWGW